MIEASKAENRIMVCSRSYAEWLQMQYEKASGRSGTWLDAVLRYWGVHFCGGCVDDETVHEIINHMSMDFNDVNLV